MSSYNGRLCERHEYSVNRQRFLAVPAMSRQIDLGKFHERSGGLDLLPVVGAAFLRQLPPWQAAFFAATESHDAPALVELLHQMRGSCHAISAHDVAHEFELAEQSVRQIASTAWQRQSCILLEQIQQIENELQSIIAVQKAK